MKTIYLNQLSTPLPPCAATVGFFDGVHRGHRFLIEQLKEKARERNLATTIVTFERHPRQVVKSDWHPKLLTDFNEKALLLAQTGIDQLAVLHFDQQMASLSAKAFISEVLSGQLNTKLLLTGYDNRFGHNREEGFDDYVRYGQELDVDVCLGQPLVLDGIQVSSSAVRRALTEGDIARANQYLGRPYFLSGRVVNGQQVGRRLGFPTANLELTSADRLLPAPGVYGVKVRLSDSLEWKHGMMNIGTRPTLEGNSQTLEVHIFRYEGDLYGQQLTVAFTHRHRSERKFDSLEALSLQLQADATAIDQALQNQIEQ